MGCCLPLMKMYKLKAGGYLNDLVEPNQVRHLLIKAVFKSQRKRWYSGVHDFFTQSLETQGLKTFLTKDY
jgi:hypothetical protein